MVVARGLPVSWALASMALLGLGTGPAASSSLVAAQSSVAWRHRGAVTSAVYATRMLGGSLGVATLGAVEMWTHEIAAARFAGVALLAFGAMASLLTMAPRVLADRAGVPAPAE